MKIALLFPGQGSQYVGMGKEYLNEYTFIKKYFDQASELFGFDILDLCLNGPEEKLNLTANAQPAILLLSYCAFNILQKEYKLEPFLLAGHSLGEISALCCSGAIGLEDALKIVRKRGELMQAAAAAGSGAMIAVNGLSIKKIEYLLASLMPQGKAVISNINSETQIVISGERDSVEKIGKETKLLGAVTIPLNVSAPFHSPLMKPAAVELESELNKYSFSKLQYPVISNVTCKPYLDENEIIPLLTEQVTKAVNWLKIMEYICKTSVNITLELPPKKTLTRLFQNHKSTITNYTFDQLKEIKDSSGINI